MKGPTDLQPSLPPPRANVRAKGSSPRALCFSPHAWEVQAEAREGVEAQAGGKVEPALFTDDKIVYEEHPKE